VGYHVVQSHQINIAIYSTVQQSSALRSLSRGPGLALSGWAVGTSVYRTPFFRIYTTMDDPGGVKTHVTWTNVGLGFSFIAFDIAISSVLGLGLGGSLFIASVRCTVQLTVVAVILERVFNTQNFWAVAGIAGPLSTLL
jgi:Uncharacterised protein family (UPF0014)